MNVLTYTKYQANTPGWLSLNAVDGLIGQIEQTHPNILYARQAKPQHLGDSRDSMDSDADVNDFHEDSRKSLLRIDLR